MVTGNAYTSMSTMCSCRSRPFSCCKKEATLSINDFTTENPEKFKEQAQIFLHETVEVGKITLER